MKKDTAAIRAILLLLGMSVILGACAKPPTEEIEAAEAAVTRAENDPDAAAYAESSLSRARNALSRARTEMNDKRYDAAKSYAAEAVSAAEKAVSDGRAAAARSREEAGSLLNQVKQLLSETETALENAQNPPRVQLDFPALATGVDSARGDISQAEAAYNANRPRESLEKSRSARSILGDIQNRISGGVREAVRKK
ncbi:MAG: DUF4398 domain-containing protein [Spirochaetaceae bacterium]|nr:DUF4398 domain-containing protein [Spirochaetaceae bacterium]